MVRNPFSQSYGAFLPSSLTRVLSLTLGVYLPVYLCWIEVRLSFIWLEDFLGSMESVTSPYGSPSHIGLMIKWICLLNHPLMLGQGQPKPCLTYPSPSLHHLFVDKT